MNPNLPASTVLPRRTRWFARLSLRQKLLGILALVTGGALLAAFGLVMLHDMDTYRREMVESSRLIAKVVGDYTISDLAFEDREAAGESLGKLAAVPAVESAILFDAQGRVFSAYGKPAEPVASIGGDAEVRLVGDGLHVVEPILYQGSRYGTIYLIASTAALDAKIARHLAVLSTVLVVALALAMALAFRLQRVVSGPILELGAITRRVTLTGDTSLRALKRAEDEIGELCDSFNDMLDQIQKRERERDAAEHRTQEKSRFLANMSHELRTPLNSIIGFSEILLSRSENLDARERRFLGNIHTSGKHLLTIINDILDLSKVEAGRMELQPEGVSVGALLEGVCTVMKGVADRDGILLELQLPPELPWIWADPVKVKQIFYNLLSNAVKFSPTGGEVRITAKELLGGDSPLGEHALEVAVRDRGIGIAPEHHQRIFDPFLQVDSTAGRRFGGTGLGLALVKTFAEMHGGRVFLDSTLGEGSEFRVVLPVRSVRVRQETETGAPLTVLVVEDEPGTYERLCAELESAGFEPVLANNGEAAVALTRSLRPAAVILDLVLPGMIDGWEVLKSLKAAPETSTIPIVVYSRQENRELGLALGADDYFLKPMDLSRLVERVGALARSGGGQKKSVLIVDDDRTVHQLLEPGLLAEGYEVIHAYTSEEGLTRARANPPALVVVDLLMERLDGLAVALELRADPATAEVPVVMLAGHDPSREERELLKAKSLLLREGSGWLSPGQQGEALPEVLRRLLGRTAPPPSGLDKRVADAG